MPVLQFTIQPPLPTRRLAGGLLVPILILAAGCEKQEEVSVYTVPTHESLQSPEFLKESAQRKPKPSRMLGAIVPRGPMLWFFKLQGPPDPVAGREPEFRQLLASVRFNASGDAEWTLPGNWQQKPGNEMRHATLVLPGDPPLEVSVTKLPVGGDLKQAVLANINRWRGQLDLPPIELDDLPSRTQTIEAGDVAVTWLNIVGKARLASAMPGGIPPMGGPARGAEPAEPSDIQYKKPDEWTQVPAKTFTIAAFEVADGEKKLSITLSRAGGAIAANVNRWRGQLGVGPLAEDDIVKTLQPFAAGGRTGQRIEIKSDTQTLIGVIFEGGNQSVFVKLVGDPELAVREQQRFDEFARSLQF